MNRKHDVLFVCSGNVCRSPMAEYLFRHRLPGDTRWTVGSAGVSAMAGLPPSREAEEVLAELGIALSRHRSRRMSRALVDAATLIVVMTSAHRDRLRTIYPMGQDKVYLLRAFDPDTVRQDIDDPIGLSVDVYREIRDEIDSALPGLQAFLETLD